MIRILPRSLAGRLIALLLLALIGAQAVAVLIFADERRIAIRSAARDQILSRTASVVRLIDGTPEELHARVLDAASSYRLRFWLSDESTVGAGNPETRDNALALDLAELLDDDTRTVLVRNFDGEPPPAWRSDERRLSQRYRRDSEERRRREMLGGLTISIGPVAERRWLNAAMVLSPPRGGWPWPLLISLGLTAAAIAVTVILVVRRITRPMQRLADAADRLGRGEATAALPEEGPEEVQRTTRAFNQMRDRLQRFVEDRTRMLAAISHDLRTPITTLRLRAEFVDDEETQRKIIDTLDEMERMTEATLAFAREEAASEETRVVDLDALVGSLCEDLVDLGKDVDCADRDPLPYPCRPVALKRAVRNLVENAVAYGRRARVAVLDGDDAVRIRIDDDGPGIVEADRERVFAPFVRLEESRNPETGGIGLGMAIARSIVRGHGGDIDLANRPEGGLSATIRLPRTTKT